MSTPRRITVHRVRCSLAVAVMVCVVGLSEQAAQASCGDWLANHVAETAPAFRDGLSAPDITSETMGTEALAQQIPAKHPKPQRCDGPACSKLPSLPVTPIEQAEVFSAPDRMAACIAHAKPAADVLISWVFENDALLLSDEPTSRIERPPMHG